jgi:hypothetical protein
MVAIVVVGVILGVAIAGVPSRHHDAPLHVPPTTVAPAPATTSP